MSVFFTDSDCELWYTEVDKYNMNVLEMPYTLDGEEYFYDMGRNTDFKKMFDRMRAGAMPMTSALNPQTYIEKFEPFFAKGEDILYVHFSDKLSGTFEYMKTAMRTLNEKYPDRKLKTFNTKSISIGGGLQALIAGKMHAEGKSDEEILAFLEENSKHFVTTFVVESLTHLKRGGRISSTSAVVGGLLNIKPILKISDEGTIEKIGTAKGMKKALMTIIEQMEKNIQKVGEYPIWVMDADNEELGAWFEGVVKEKFPTAKVERFPVGPVIGAHCGPGTIGITYYVMTR